MQAPFPLRSDKSCNKDLPRDQPAFPRRPKASSPSENRDSKRSLCRMRYARRSRSSFRPLQAPLRWWDASKTRSCVQRQEAFRRNRPSFLPCASACRRRADRGNAWSSRFRHSCRRPSSTHRRQRSCRFRSIR